MTIKAGLKPARSSVPVDPGVYRFRDRQQRVIYVGKARNLRARVASYFQEPSALHPRTRSMLEDAHSLDWTVVSTEVEALQLEFSWIKEFDPRFNVKYRDDKSYPYLAVTLGEPIPRVQVLRGQQRKGVRYFGPYSHAWAIRDTVDQLLKVFPVRTCSSGVYRTAKASGRPCLLGYIGKCVAPCVERVSPDEHRALVDDLCRFLSSDTAPFVRALEAQMRTAAEEQDYERAARLRDQIKALERALERQSVVLPPSTDVDVVGVYQDDLEVAVQVFFVRAGRIRGRRGWITEKVEDIDTASLIEHFLVQLYGAVQGDPPREVLVPVLPLNVEAVAGFLTHQRGARVAIKVPHRGDKRALLDTVERNAAEAFVQNRLKRSSDLTTRSRAMQEVQDALGLAEPPLRIECIDISHLGGTNVVGSLVVYEDGLAKRSDYRHFAVADEDATDDVRSISSVVRRRFRQLAEAATATEGQPSGRRPKVFSYRPHLLVVDGGPAQAQAARDVLDELSIDGVAVVGLAKRLEELWPAGSPDPVILARGSEGLYLLQRVRDEAHRFAITYQRKRRAQVLKSGALDAIPGLGPVRRTAVLKHFGSVKRLRAATVEDIAAVDGIGPTMAASIYSSLHAETPAGTPPRGAVLDTSTGEIMES